MLLINLFFPENTMKVPPIVVIEFVEASTPLFRVIRVDQNLISEGNITVGELLSDSDIDFLLELWGDHAVEVKYPK